MKERLFRLLERRGAVIAVIAIATLLAQADRNFGYFFGLGVVLFMVWCRRWDWASMGFGTRLTWATVGKSLAYTAVLFIALSVIETFLQESFGYFDLSSLDDLRGNTEAFLITLVIMWVFAAFGEELLFRGYYQQQFASLLGGGRLGWWAAALGIAVYFGVSHAYQGTAGMISVGLAGLFYATLFIRHRNNLALVALVHGFYDTLGLTLVYLEQYEAFYRTLLRWMTDA